MSDHSLSRKDFIRLAGLGGAALLLGLYLPSSAKEPQVITPDQLEHENIELSAWILINTSGKVTIMCHRAEMGQGAYHSVAQIIAEELEVDLDKVNIEFATGNSKKFGSQVTGGSSTIRSSYKKLLKLSATARELLIQAAAISRM